MISSKTLTRFALVAAVLLTPGISAIAGDAGAQASPAPEKKSEFKRPPYNPVSRWKEDWSGLHGLDRNNTGDPAFDPLKFIPLNDDGSIWLSLGGGLRGRLENFGNFNFAPNLDASYVLYHLLLHGDLHITKLSASTSKASMRKIVNAIFPVVSAIPMLTPPT